MRGLKPGKDAYHVHRSCSLFYFIFSYRIYRGRYYAKYCGGAGGEMATGEKMKYEDLGGKN